MENFYQQQNLNSQQNRQSQEQNLQPNLFVCKHCGASLEEDQLFCPECGEKVGGEERICPVCKISTTSEFCPNCGTRVIPIICPNCGKESFSDFCESCGTIINEQLQQFFEQPLQEIQQMSQVDAEQIKKEVEQSITPEVQQFLKKIEEHRILLEEREYFNKREKRIIKVFGQNPFELIEQSLEEKAFMTKMYEGIRKTVIERRNKEINDKLKQLFPDLENDSRFEEEQKQKAEQLRLENEAKKAEMEKRYNELLSNVTSEFQKAQLAEQKRLEEERLRKEAEERERRRKEQEERERKEQEERERKEREARERERLRLEQEARERAIIGEYVWDGSWVDRLKLTERNGTYLKGSVFCKTPHGYSSESFIGAIYGNTITLNVYSYYINGPLKPYLKFYGRIEDDIISGYWVMKDSSVDVTYYKY